MSLIFRNIVDMAKKGQLDGKTMAACVQKLNATTSANADLSTLTLALEDFLDMRKQNVIDDAMLNVLVKESADPGASAS